jgi:hypothetical protein
MPIYNSDSILAPFSTIFRYLFISSDVTVHTVAMFFDLMEELSPKLVDILVDINGSLLEIPVEPMEKRISRLAYYYLFLHPERIDRKPNDYLSFFQYTQLPRAIVHKVMSAFVTSYEVRTEMNKAQPVDRQLYSFSTRGTYRAHFRWTGVQCARIRDVPEYLDITDLSKVDLNKLKVSEILPRNQSGELVYHMFYEDLTEDCCTHIVFKTTKAWSALGLLSPFDHSGFMREIYSLKEKYGFYFYFHNVVGDNPTTYTVDYLPDAGSLKWLYPAVDSFDKTPEHWYRSVAELNMRSIHVEKDINEVRKWYKNYNRSEGMFREPSGIWRKLFGYKNDIEKRVKDCAYGVHRSYCLGFNEFSSTWDHLPAAEFTTISETEVDPFCDMIGMKCSYDLIVEPIEWNYTTQIRSDQLRRKQAEGIVATKIAFKALKSQQERAYALSNASLNSALYSELTEEAMERDDFEYQDSSSDDDEATLEASSTSTTPNVLIAALDSVDEADGGSVSNFNDLSFEGMLELVIKTPGMSIDDVVGYLVTQSGITKDDLRAMFGKRAC